MSPTLIHLGPSLNPFTIVGPKVGGLVGHLVVGAWVGLEASEALVGLSVSGAPVGASVLGHGW